MDHTNHTGEGHFRQHAVGLPTATRSELVDLVDGDTFELMATPVRKLIGDAEVRLLAYNGSIPGPTLRVRQGSTVTVNFTNQIDLESTVHWHGLRLDNRYDGTQATQAPVPIGGSFTYQLSFPDPGVYWYHPHIREDYGQEMGLYGNVLVVPEGADYWPPVHREISLILDDILIEDGKVGAFSRSGSTYTAMGRFGNVMLTSGESNPQLSVRPGEVIRFYFTDTANTRVFNVGFTNARMKLVGGDSGRVEREELVERVMLAPSERVIVDVLFEQPGEVELQHYTPERTYTLATVTVSGEPATPVLADAFFQLRTNSEFVAERDRLAPYLDQEPDKTLAFVAHMDMGAHEAGEEAGPYACPMHPEMISGAPGRCPKCGMQLLPSHVVESAATQHGHGRHMEHHTMDHEGHESHEHGHDAHAEDHAGHQHAQEAHAHHHAEHAQQHGHDEHVGHHAGHVRQHGGHAHQATDGIEWEDEMEAINRMTTPANMRWMLVDRETGGENHAIAWRFRVGERVKIRLVNELDSDHPMQHPFHIHGAGRFLVLARDGVVEPNLMWKDTVLVKTGETVDILLEVTNPGIWMAHCHIAEHHEGGMMFSFQVDE